MSLSVGVVSFGLDLVCLVWCSISATIFSSDSLALDSTCDILLFEYFVDHGAPAVAVMRFIRVCVFLVCGQPARCVQGTS